MESIFHEKQEGYLCAQHCLNALLQGPYFNAVDLASFGHQMDEEERIRMAESGTDSEDYRLFLEQPSGNMDDSGYFSVQVISSALKVWGLELIPYNSTEPAALMAQKDPSKMQAYICNYKGHWFTIRKLGIQWFNLNSMLSGPQLISDTYLAMYLAQLIQEGYSIFVVIGTLPQCPADDALSRYPVVASKLKPAIGEEPKPVSKGYRLGTKAEDDMLRAALALGEVSVPSTSRTIAPISADAPFDNTVTENYSRQSYGIPKEVSTNKPRERIIPITLEGVDDDEESRELQRAVEMSLQESKNDVDKNLKLRLSAENDARTINETPKSVITIEDTEEDEELTKALQLSLECVTAPPTPDPEDIRWRRLSHFGFIPRVSNNEASPKLNS